MSPNNYYTYIQIPNKIERNEIREKYFNFNSIRIENKQYYEPIKINLMESSFDESLNRHQIQRVEEYASAINDELFALDFLFVSFAHTYQKCKNDKENWCMYKPILKLYAETYVSKFISINEKIILTIINVTNLDKNFKKDNWKYGSRDKKHKSVMNFLMFITLNFQH